MIPAAQPKIAQTTAGFPPLDVCGVAGIPAFVVTVDSARKKLAATLTRREDFIGSPFSGFCRIV